MLHILRLNVSNCSVTHRYTKFLFWPLLNFKTVIDICTAELIIDIRIITYGNPINGTALIKINFTRGCGYYIILLLRGNYTLLHCSTLSTCCIKATVCSIRYFN